jgi:hypothetical protein
MPSEVQLQVKPKVRNAEVDKLPHAKLVYSRVGINELNLRILPSAPIILRSYPLPLLTHAKEVLEPKIYRGP